MDGSISLIFNFIKTTYISLLFQMSIKDKKEKEVEGRDYSKNGIYLIF